jgi:hypothetical protein
MTFEELQVNNLLYRTAQQTDSLGQSAEEQKAINEIAGGFSSYSVSESSSYSETPSESITSGDIAGDLFVTQGFLRSKNYVDGVSGWTINADGSSQFKDIELIGGTISYGKTSFSDSTNAGYYISSAGFYIGSASDATKLKYTIADGSLSLIGDITATSGTIGGWTIGATTISSTNIIIDSANQRLRSSNYVTGVSGFTIEPNLLEAQNGIFRGQMMGSVMTYQEQSCVGGDFLGSNADSLASDITALDTSTLVTKNTSTFAENDMLKIQSRTALGIQTEYLRVIDTGYALDLERSSSQSAYRAGANLVGLKFTGDFTIEVDIKLESLPSVAGTLMNIVGRWTTDGNQRSYRIYIDTDDKLKVSFSADGTTTLTTIESDSAIATAGELGTWMHLAVAVDVSAPSAVMYKNEAVTACTNTASAATAVHAGTSYFMVGYNYNGGGVNYFDGLIKDIRVWDDIRSGAEILANYDTPLLGTETNLQLYVRCNNNVLDQTDNSNDLTLANSPTYTASSPYGNTIPTYIVTRDLAGSFAADTNPIWQKGTAVVKVGNANATDDYSGGWLRLLGEGTNSPHYSVFSRTGVAYNAYTEIIRMGNLNGIGGNTSETFGIFMGNYPDSYVQINASGASVVDAPITSLMTIGENITATRPYPIYIDTSDGKVYLCDDTSATKLAYTGFIIESATADETKRIQFSGIVVGFGSLLKTGSTYYLKKDAETRTGDTTQSSQNESFAWGLTGGTGYLELGQTFTTGTEFTSIQSIVLKLKKVNSPTDNLIIEVYQTDKTTLLGTSDSVAGSSLTTSAADYTFAFSTPVLLEASTQYFFKIKRSGAYDNTNYYELYDQNSDAYAGGAWWRNVSGVGWSTLTKDAYFIINYKEAYSSGNISLSAGSTSVKVGRAISNNKLLIYQLDI